MNIHRSSPPLRWLWLALFLALSSISCSGSGSTLVPVEGKVLYKNEPAKGVLVTFHPKGGDPIKTVRPVGLTGEDGAFTLTTGTDKGAAPGEYTVTFIWSEEVSPKGKGKILTEAPDTRDRLGGAFADVAKSPFRVKIEPGTNQLQPFELK
ncbi:MAG: hypothetical protein L0Z62_31510 [Gemmataceae bacterium]|nr:hypothetical protein [Gemmataceae bacterium]